MIFCGIPIFFQEVALGQYLGAGGMTMIGDIHFIISLYNRINDKHFLNNRANRSYYERYP